VVIYRLVIYLSIQKTELITYISSGKSIGAISSINKNSKKYYNETSISKHLLF
jgi:hypothetical protein